MSTETDDDSKRGDCALTDPKELVKAASPLFKEWIRLQKDYNLDHRDPLTTLLTTLLTLGGLLAVVYTFANTGSHLVKLLYPLSFGVFIGIGFFLFVVQLYPSHKRDRESNPKLLQKTIHFLESHELWIFLLFTFFFILIGLTFISPTLDIIPEPVSLEPPAKAFYEVLGLCIAPFLAYFAFWQTNGRKSPVSWKVVVAFAISWMLLVTSGAIVANNLSFQRPNPPPFGIYFGQYRGPLLSNRNYQITLTVVITNHDDKQITDVNVFFQNPNDTVMWSKLLGDVIPTIEANQSLTRYYLISGEIQEAMVNNLTIIVTAKATGYSDSNNTFSIPLTPVP